MRVSKPLRWILYILGGLIASFLLIIILLSIIRIPIDLSSHKGLVESAESLALGRSVKIDERIVITTSVRPPQEKTRRRNATKGKGRCEAGFAGKIFIAGNRRANRSAGFKHTADLSAI